MNYTTDFNYIRGLLNAELVKYINYEGIRKNGFIKLILKNLEAKIDKGIKTASVKDFMAIVPSRYYLDFSLNPKELRSIILKNRHIPWYKLVSSMFKLSPLIMVRYFYLKNLIVDKVIIDKGASPKYGKHYLHDTINGIVIPILSVVVMKLKRINWAISNQKPLLIRVSYIDINIYYNKDNIRKYQLVAYMANPLKDMQVGAKAAKKPGRTYAPLYWYKGLPQNYPRISPRIDFQEHITTLQLGIIDKLRYMIDDDIYTTLVTVHSLDKGIWRSIYCRFLYTMCFCWSIFNKIYSVASIDCPDNEIVKKNEFDQSVLEINTIFNLSLRVDQINAAKLAIENIYNGKEVLIFADVGSGKTLVAINIIKYFNKIMPDWNMVYIAPTRILCEQVKGLCEKAKLKVNVTTIRADFLNSDRENICDLAIVDEEQKFGLGLKDNVSTRLIKLTATPIPMSLVSKTSTILSLDSAERNIFTVFVDLTNNKYSFQELVDVLKKHKIIVNISHAIFKIPIILKIIEGYLSKEFAKEDYVVYVLHAKVPKSEQDEILKNLTNQKKYIVLIATTVFEVGVDIKTLSSIFIWNPERYGLSQLHQLRGRVGRNKQESVCYLVLHPELNDRSLLTKQKKRIEFFAKYGTGLKLSYIDTVLRGSGDFTKKAPKQHGDKHPLFNFMAIYMLDHLSEYFKDKYRELLNILT